MGICSSTTTTQLAVLPLLVFTVIIAVPFAFAVTFPLISTATILLSLVDHVNLLLLTVLYGSIVAISVLVSFVLKDKVFLFKLTEFISAPVAPGTVTLKVILLSLLSITFIIIPLLLPSL